MSATLLLDIILILSLSWFLGSVAKRMGLPAMVGQLIAGMLLGPPFLGIVQPSHALEIFGEIGIFLVMFHTGMELDIRGMLRNLLPAIAVAMAGFILPFGLGMLVCKAFGGTFYQSLFVGLGLSVTAIAVQSVILHEMGLMNSRVGHIVIGAAIFDDVLSLIALSALLGVTRSGTFDLLPLMWVLGKVCIFFIATFIVGNWLIPKVRLKFHEREAESFTLALLVALAMALLAELAGLHMIIGAFLAGQLMRHEKIFDPAVHKAIFDRFYGLSYGSLVPIFFATLSFHITLEPTFSFAFFALTLIIAAVAGKLIGCGLAAKQFDLSSWEAAIVGFGMNGRGAVELVIAAVGLNHSAHLMDAGTITSPLLTDTQFTGLILMAFVTTIMAPFGLKWAIYTGCQKDEKVMLCVLTEESRKRGK